MWPRLWQFQATLWQLPAITCLVTCLRGIAEQHWEYANLRTEKFWR